MDGILVGGDNGHVSARTYNTSGRSSQIAARGPKRPELRLFAIPRGRDFRIETGLELPDHLSVTN